MHQKPATVSLDGIAAAARQGVELAMDERSRPGATSAILYPYILGLILV